MRPRACPEVLGRRLRWGTILCFTGFPLSALSAIIGLVITAAYGVFAADYLIQVRRAGAAPMGHRFTVACIVVAVLLVLLPLRILAVGSLWR